MRNERTSPGTPAQIQGDDHPRRRPRASTSSWRGKRDGARVFRICYHCRGRSGLQHDGCTNVEEMLVPRIQQAILKTRWRNRHRLHPGPALNRSAKGKIRKMLLCHMRPCGCPSRLINLFEKVDGMEGGSADGKVIAPSWLSWGYGRGGSAWQERSCTLIYEDWSSWSWTSIHAQYLRGGYYRIM